MTGAIVVYKGSKLVVYRMLTFKSNMFQFYLSSIKRITEYIESNDENEFQFYLSSIKSYMFISSF